MANKRWSDFYCEKSQLSNVLVSRGQKKMKYASSVNRETTEYIMFDKF